MTNRFQAELTPTRAGLIAEYLDELADDPDIHDTVYEAEIHVLAEYIRDLGHRRRLEQMGQRPDRARQTIAILEGDALYQWAHTNQPWPQQGVAS